MMGRWLGLHRMQLRLCAVRNANHAFMEPLVRLIALRCCACVLRGSVSQKICIAPPEYLSSKSKASLL